MKQLLLLAIALVPLLAAAQNYATGLDLGDKSYKNVPVKARLISRDYTSLPAAVSLKAYCPLPGDQNCPTFILNGETKQPYCQVQRNGLGTCIAWSAAYGARTIMDAKRNGWTDKKVITANAYAPGFTYFAIKKSPNCNGSNAGMPAAFRDMRDNGCPKMEDFTEHCPDDVSESILKKAKQGKIKDFITICREDDDHAYKVEAIKKALSEGLPVVTAVICPNSLSNAKMVWQPTENPATVQGGHAMCIVGYDNDKYGGAFEILNSWGSNWGNQGFIWMSYDDFCKFMIYSFEMFPIDAPKPAPPVVVVPPKPEPPVVVPPKPATETKIVLKWTAPTAVSTMTEHENYPIAVNVQSQKRLTDVSLYLNGALSRGQSTVPSNISGWWIANYERNIKLFVGENRIKITATTEDGKITSEERVVTLSAPKPESLVDFSGKLSLMSSTGAAMLAQPIKTRGQFVVSALDKANYRLKNPVKSGDRYRILLSNNEPAYVYVLASDLTHNVSILFPHEANISPALTYKSNHVALPDEAHWIELDNTIGTDYTCVLYSKENLDIQSIQNQVKEGSGTFRERLDKALKDKLVDEKNVVRLENEIGFSAKSDGKSVVGFILEMKHE
ncbi:MAG: hypothetical protein RLZZ628_1472 [Bacteroidota bacterium]|jgi:hypothetical protein